METICKDCGQDYGNLNRNGICFYCSRRKANFKYHKKEYIPLINIKGSKEYDRAMSKRIGMTVKKETNTKETNTKEIIHNKIEMKEIVEKDLEKYYKDKGITSNNNFISLEIIFEWFYSLCQEENYMIDLDKRRQIYDMLIVDYLHELKHANLDDRNYFADVGEKIAIVQQMRTPIDSEVDKYKVIEPVIQKVQKDDELMKLLMDVRIKLLEKIKIQQDPKYISNTPSLQEHDFVIKSVTEEGPVRKISKPTLKNRYTAKILSVKGLYGNPISQPFYYKSSIFADSVEEAKQSFLKMMKKDFSNLFYKTSDVVIEPWSDSNDLKKELS